MATGTQPVTITNKNTGAVLYTATVRRDTSVYPLTAAGAAAFATAIGAGEHALVAFNGAVIPAGNFPPATVPPAQPVSWLTGLRYSYSAGNLLVEAAGEGVALMVEAVAGTYLTGLDDQGFVVHSGIFYGYIPNTGQGVFDKAWRFNKSAGATGGVPASPVKITLKRNSTGLTSVYLFTPTEGALQVDLLTSTILSDDISLSEIEVDSSQFVDGIDPGTTPAPAPAPAPPPPASQPALVATPITTYATEQCSGNATEKRSFSLSSPAVATGVPLRIMAKATEGASTLVVQVNQQPAVSVPLTQGTVYVEVTTPLVDLINGANTILIWSGATYLCVNKISATVQAPASSSSTTPPPSNPPPSGGFTIGPEGFDTSYTFSKVGSDYNGVPFADSPAPLLLNVARTKPRINGNNYPFATQLAFNTALHKRLPVHYTHARKTIVFPGNLYLDPADNEFTGRGWTHSSEAAVPQEAVYPTNIKRAIESAFYDMATLAATRPGVTQAQKDQLNGWAAVPHILINDDSAARLYAKEWVNVFEQSDWYGAGVEGFSVNHEVFQARVASNYFSEWYHHSGLMTRAIRDEMISRLKPDGSRKFPVVKAAATDFGALVTYGPAGSDMRATLNNAFLQNTPDPDPSVPMWLHFSTITECYRGSSRAQPLGSGSILGQMLKDGQLYAGSGQYPRFTMDSQSMWQKNADNSYKTDANGWMMFRTDVRTTTVNGETCTLRETDYKRAMEQLYGYFAQFYAYYFFKAGSKHMPMSTDIIPGWEAMQRGYAQFRLNTEIDTTYAYPAGTNLETYNSRPLNRQWTETYAIGMYLFMDYIRGWMNVQHRTAVGATNDHDGQSRASVEFFAKGFQRGANLNWIHDVPYQLGAPKFFLFEQATNASEQLFRKPITSFGLATYLGKPTIWLNMAWPCQDEDRTTEVIIWGDNGAGTVTPAYRILLTGRDPYLDWWHLPDTATGLQPKDIYFQFNSFLNEKITWRGDYREAVITVHPTPPALA